MTARRISVVAVLFFTWVSANAADSLTNESAQWDRIFERFRTERRSTNISSSFSTSEAFTNLVKSMVVHPSFGIWWNEMPPPDVTDSVAMTAVNAFIKMNGWNMASGQLTSLSFQRGRPLRGIPWECVRTNEFDALTHNGILYVVLSGWHHNLHGVAYNPNTNVFPDRIQGFVSLTNHWYAWVHPEDWHPVGTHRQRYEGEK